MIRLENGSYPPLGATIHQVNNNANVGMVSEDGHAWLGASTVDNNLQCNGANSKPVTLHYLNYWISPQSSYYYPVIN